MVWVTLSRNTWDSFMFELSLLLCWLSTSSARRGSFLVSLSQWSLGMLDAAPSKQLFESVQPTVASCLRTTCRGWEGILWMFFYDGDLQEINQYDVFMVSLWDICIFLQTLSRTPHQVLMSALWESHVGKNSLFVLFFYFCVLSVLWLLFFFSYYIFPDCHVPLCVFSTCLIISTCCCLCIWRETESKRVKNVFFFLQRTVFNSALNDWLINILSYF